MMPRGEPRRGAALIVVLLFSALLAELAATALCASVSGARSAMVFADVMRADELGRSAADILAYHLGQGGPEVRRGGTIAVNLPEAEIVIDYLSESARIDVNSAPIPLIAALLSAAEASPETLRAVLEQITRLRGADAAKTGDSPVLAPAGGGPRAPLPPTGTPTSAAAGPSSLPLIQDVADVPRQWALPEPLAARILPALTIANGSAAVDPLLAGRLVLAALMGGDAIRVDDYIARRQQGFATNAAALDLLPVASRSFANFTDAAPVHALARVTIAHRFVRRYDLVLDPPSGAGPAVKLLSWQPKL